MQRFFDNSDFTWFWQRLLFKIKIETMWV